MSALAMQASNWADVPYNSFGNGRQRRIAPKQYKVFEHPNGVREAVKQGWSWPGFCFGVFWAFVKRLWLLGGSVLLASWAIGVCAGLAGLQGADTLMSLAGLIVGVVFAANGNRWREKNLCGIRPCGVPRPSLADYVMATGPRRGATAARRG